MTECTVENQFFDGNFYTHIIYRVNVQATYIKKKPLALQKIKFNV